MVWRAIAYSATGRLHQQQQRPCQDYSQYRLLESMVIGAIADGAGSARYAEVGAKLAVETSLNFLATPIDNSKSAAIALQGKPTPTLDRARTLFTQVVQQVLIALTAQAKIVECRLADLASTLLVFVATPEWTMALQIGDGFLVVGTPATQQYQLLFQPQKGEFINQTTFVTAADVLEQMQVCVCPGLQPFVCAASDGLETVAIRLRDWLPYPPFFQPLADCLQTLTGPGEAETYLQTFLESERLNARTLDDKTLLLCLYGSVSCQP